MEASTNHMNPSGFAFYPGQGTAEILSTTPGPIRQHLKQGFSLLSRISPDADTRVLEVIRKSVLGAAPSEDEGLPAELALSPEETSAVLAAASFISMALATTSDTPANILGGLQSSGVLEGVLSIYSPLFVCSLIASLVLLCCAAIVQGQIHRFLHRQIKYYPLGRVVCCWVFALASIDFHMFILLGGQNK
jgi:hypothetical protein